MASIVLLAAGDVALGRGVAAKIAEHGPLFPFQLIAPIFRKADVVVINLECPLTRSRHGRTDAAVIFRGDPEAVKGLVDAGVTVATLANNHMLDYGEEGLLDTLQALESARILYTGAGPTLESARAPVLLERKDVRMAFLAYSTSVPWGKNPGRGTIAVNRLGDIVADVRSAGAVTDIVIVSLHQGYEYVDYPLPHHRELAHAVLDAGASLVIGHHPHCLQCMERHNGGIVFHSLGNLVMDYEDGIPKSRESILVRCMIGKEGVEHVELLPLRINTENQPEVLSGENGEEILSRFQVLSERLADSNQYGRFWAEAGSMFVKTQFPVSRELLRRDFGGTILTKAPGCVPTTFAWLPVTI